MASDECVSAFSALDEAPLAPLYGSDFVVLGKRVLMSSFNAPFGSKIVFNSLKEIFPAQAQMVLMPSSNGIPLTLEAMTYSQIVEAVDLQIRSETYGILPLDKKLEFDNLKAQYESATNEAEKAGCLDLIKELVYTSVLLSLANASLKGFASYLDTHSGFQMMLLDNRKTYTADQGKVKGIAARAKRAKDRTNAKTSKPSAIPPRSAAGKIRKQISDVSEEDSDSSSTSMGISCHGKHTSSSDSNDDFNDGAYGKLPANTSLPEASLSTSADHASQGSLPTGANNLQPSASTAQPLPATGGPPSLAVDHSAFTIPKKKRLSKKERKAAERKAASELRSSAKKAAKKSKAKKHSKKNKKHSSSSSSEPSSSSSSGDGSSSASEQVFSHSPNIYLFYFIVLVVLCPYYVPLCGVGGVTPMYVW